jgi:hypothetical protein
MPAALWFTASSPPSPPTVNPQSFAQQQLTQPVGERGLSVSKNSEEPMHRDTVEQLIGAAAILLFAIGLVVYQNLWG